GEIRRLVRLAGGGGQAVDGLDETTERETLARTGWADDSGQERRLRLGEDAEFGKRLGGVAGVLMIRAIAGVGVEDGIARGDRRRVRRLAGRLGGGGRRLADQAPQSIVHLAFDQ